MAGMVLLAGFVRAWVSQNEVGPRFRTATVSRLSLLAVAAVSYVLLAIGFVNGYDRTDAGYVPNAEAVNAFMPRYMDWSVTVPLLCIELLAVCTLAGVAARRTQAVAVTAAFLMVFTGFLGAFVFGEGESIAALLIWGAISAVFWVATNVVLIRAVRHSVAELTPEGARLLKRATVILLAGWVIYPIIYLIPIFGDGGAVTTTIQLMLCVADVVIKVGFGTVIHHVAKLRTAEDVRAGEDVHPEAIWISSEKQSDAGAAREVFLADGATVHQRRGRPPMTMATSSEPNLPDEHHDLNMDDV